MNGWHITSRNRATKICLRGLQAGNDFDSFGAFQALGPQLLALHGSKPAYLSISSLGSIQPQTFARHLHVGLQQLRAVHVDLDGLDLQVDLPMLAERYDMRFKRDRIVIAGPDAPLMNKTRGEFYELLRKAAVARKGALSVPISALDQPALRDWCIQQTGSATARETIMPPHVLGVYTLSQAQMVVDHEARKARQRAA
jgi:hypothetical protein